MLKDLLLIHSLYEQVKTYLTQGYPIWQSIVALLISTLVISFTWFIITGTHDKVRKLLPEPASSYLITLIAVARYLIHIILFLLIVYFLSQINSCSEGKGPGGDDAGGPSESVQPDTTTSSAEQSGQPSGQLAPLVIEFEQDKDGYAVGDVLYFIIEGDRQEYNVNNTDLKDKLESILRGTGINKVHIKHANDTEEYGSMLENIIKHIDPEIEVTQGK